MNINITNYGNTLCYSNKEWSLSTEYLNIAPSFKAILLYEWVMVPVRPGKKCLGSGHRACRF